MKSLLKKAKEIIDGSFFSYTYFKAEGVIEGVKWERERSKGLVEALEKIRSTNGLQYSDIFEIADKALANYKKSED